MQRNTLRSLLSVALTAVAITANHTYVLGARAFVLGAVLLIVPPLLLAWYRSTGNRAALGAHQLVSAWIVVGFGLVKGLWGITLPLFVGTLAANLSTSYPTPTLRTFGYEASGLLMFVGSLFVADASWRLFREHGQSAGEGAPSVPPAAGRAVLAAGALAAVAVVATYLAVDRDRFTAPRDGVVRIAVVVPTSAPYSILGNSFLKAVEMARRDLRGTRYRYELVPVDTGVEPAAARAAIRRVVEGGRVDAVLGGISLFGQVTKPFATAARIPHLCVCTVTSIGDGAYNFTNIPSPQAEAVRWVEEARRRGITDVALLSQDYPSIVNHVKALKAEAAREGLHIVSEQTFDGAVADYLPLIERARAARPDVYYVEALTPGLDLLAEQLSKAGVRDIASVVAPSLSRRQDLFEGAWYTDSDLRDFAFKTRFEKAYPGTQFATHMMPYAYDNLNLIVRAFETGQSPAVYLRNLTRYEGTAGPVTRERGSGNFQSAPAVWVIEHGKPALVS